MSTLHRLPTGIYFDLLSRKILSWDANCRHWLLSEGMTGEWGKATLGSGDGLRKHGVSTHAAQLISSRFLGFPAEIADKLHLQETFMHIHSTLNIQSASQLIVDDYCCGLDCKLNKQSEYHNERNFKFMNFA